MQNLFTDLLPSPGTFRSDIVVAPSLAGRTAELLARIGFADKELAIICDEATHAVLGKRIRAELAAFKTRLVLLEGKLSADSETAQIISSEPAQAFVAVGSGTISDLCKHASHTSGRPYAVFPTAPSMNGYLSANASITTRGVKSTLPAHLPEGVFCDLEVMATSPVRLIRAGLGDCLARPTAQADWLLSHLALHTAYDARPFEMAARYENELFARAGELAQGNLKAVELLTMTLLASGLGMTIAGGSYPASQSEHMIAHTMEMRHGTDLAETLHGEQIGVTTLTMAALQEDVLSRPLILPPLPDWEESLIRYLGVERAALIAHDTRGKYVRYDAAAEQLAITSAGIAEQIRAVMIPHTTLELILRSAGAATTPKELGWNEIEYDAACRHAPFTRSRFTFLDLR